MSPFCVTIERTIRVILGAGRYLRGSAHEDDEEKE